MMASSSPEMSVVLVTPDSYEAIRKTIKHLRAQTVSNRLEIVIVAPSAVTLHLDESDLKEFFQFHVVEVGGIRSTGGAIAAGVRQATGPIVTYAEEHSYPDPAWAEALIKAHRQPWAAVGAVIANANPGSMISWAHVFIAYSPWVEPAVGGETSFLAWHHTSYKRAILLEYGPRLQDLLETEGILHRDLRARGYRLYLESAAKSYHVNVSLLSSFLRAELIGGRMFGAARARHERWSVFRRLLYIGGAPLIPLVRLRRLLLEMRRSGRQRDLLPGVLPALIMGLIGHATGEATGYAFGSGNASERSLTFELHRHHHLREQDRQAKAG